MITQRTKNLLSLSSRIYMGEISPPNRDNAKENLVNYSDTVVDSRIGIHEGAMVRDFPSMDNDNWDREPETGKIKLSDYEAEFEGTAQSGKFRETRYHPTSGTVRSRTVLFQDSGVWDVQMERWRDDSVTGTVQYLDRNDWQKSFTQKLDQDWLLAK